MVTLFTLYYPKREIIFLFIPMPMWLLLTIFLVLPLVSIMNGATSNVAVEAHLAGAGFAFLYKQFDLRWSRLVSGRLSRPRLRTFLAGASRTEPVAVAGSVPLGRECRRLPPGSIGLRYPRRAAQRAARRSPRQDRPRGPIGPDRGRAPGPPGGQPPRSHQAERPAVSIVQSSPLSIREAVPGDLPAVVEFNRLLALETEAKILDNAVLARGVARASPSLSEFATGSQPSRANHCPPGKPQSRGSGATGANGWIWWLQSVYVAQPFRRQGVFRRLYQHIHSEASRQLRRHRPTSIRRRRQRARHPAPIRPSA